MLECCRDGLVFTQDKKGYTYLRACPCPLGEKHQKPMYQPSDREKQNPIQLPVWGPSLPPLKKDPCKEAATTEKEEAPVLERMPYKD